MRQIIANQIQKLINSNNQIDKKINLLRNNR
jgi:hypothetical protein